MTGYSDAIALDQNGNAYVAGIVYQGQNAKASVVEVDSTGARIVYSQVFGGSGGGVAVTDVPQAIAVDAQGYVYVAGTTYSPDFPVTPGAFQSTLNGRPCDPSICGGDAYLVKLNPRTSQIVYGTYLGGSSWDYVGGLAVDAAGNAYLAGWTRSPDFPVTPGAFQNTFKPSVLSSFQGYVAKINPAGSGLLYSTYLGGSWSDQVFALAIDSAGAAYVTGHTLSPDFPVTPGTYLTMPEATFVSKLTPGGDSLTFSTGLASDSVGLSIAVDSSGRVIVGGGTLSKTFPVVSPLQVGPSKYIGDSFCTYVQYGQLFPCQDAFLTEFDALGQQLVWSSYLGDAGLRTAVTSLGLDAAGNIYATGTGLRGLALFPGVEGPTTAIKIVPVGPPPLLVGDGVVNAATYANYMTDGSLVTIFGTQLSEVQGVVAASSLPLPTELSGVSVWVNDVPAPILAVANVDGREQINIQAPFGSSPFSIVVKNHEALGFASLTPVYGPQPGIFTATDGTAAILHGSDYSVVTASNPARVGEVVLVYATSLGDVAPPVAAGAAAPVSPLSWTVKPVTAQIGGVGAPVQFAGLAPGFAGLYQVNVLVPQVPAGTQSVVIAETAAGISSSPPVQIPVR
jgi:uncharacterized protein (TIGR03437 family)